MIDRFQKEVESRAIVEDDRVLNGFSQILDKCDKSAIRSSCLFFLSNSAVNSESDARKATESP